MSGPEPQPATAPRNDREMPREKGTEEAATPRDGRAARPREIGGPEGPEPTRYGDWEKGGRCIDF